MKEETLKELEKAGFKVIKGFEIKTESFDKLSKKCEDYIKKQKEIKKNNKVTNKCIMQ